MNFLLRSRKTRSGDAPVMCRMRETDTGSVHAQRFGSSMACPVCSLFRLRIRVTGQVLLQGSKTFLQGRLLQVSSNLSSSFYKFYLRFEFCVFFFNDNENHWGLLRARFNYLDLGLKVSSFRNLFFFFRMIMRTTGNLFE